MPCTLIELCIKQQRRQVYSMLIESNRNLFSSSFSWGARYITKGKDRAYQGELCNEDFKKILRKKKWCMP